MHAVSSGWEYRWFAPLTDLARLERLRAGTSREDTYYVATNDLGVKLRNGRGNVGWRPNASERMHLARRFQGDGRSRNPLGQWGVDQSR